VIPLPYCKREPSLKVGNLLLWLFCVSLPKAVSLHASNVRPFRTPSLGLFACGFFVAYRAFHHLSCSA
jgi:hypothetical protein